jgi:hypothetical protein
VISDAHEGLKAAIRRVLGATWQRCRVQTTSTEERHLLSATRFVVPDVASDHGVDLAEPAGSAGVLLILAPDRPQNTVESIRRLAARCAGRGFA